MKPVHRSFAVLAVLAIGAAPACLITPDDGDGFTKDEARDLGGVDGDGNDICAAEGWYDDGACDDFCPIFDAQDCPVSDDCPDPNDPAVHYKAGPGDISCAQEIAFCTEGQIT